MAAHFRITRIMKRSTHTTVSDLVEGEPDVVFISKRTEKTYVKDGYFAIYSNAQDPRFPAFWSGYRKSGSVADFEIHVRSGG